MIFANIHTIIFLLASALSTYAMKIFFDNFLINYRFSKKLIFIACLVYYVINSATFLSGVSPPIMMVANLLQIFGVSLCYQTALKNQFVFTMFFVALGVSSDALSTYAIGAYYKISLANLLEHDNLFSISTVLTAIIIYILTKIICRLFGKVEDTKIPFFYWLAICIVPTSSLFVIHVIDTPMLNSNQPISELSSIAIVMLLLINVLVFFLFERIINLSKIRTQNALLSLQNDYYTKQYQIIENSNAEVRQLRHDLKGHLSAVKAYADSENTTEIKAYVENLLGKIEYADSFSNCGILAIDGIVNLKMNEAERLGAKIDVAVNVPADITINPVDLTVILSNILDNAVEACQYVEQAKRFITVRIHYDKKNLFINVINSCDDSMIAKSGKGQRTTKRNRPGEIHGLGLDGVKRIIEKYDGSITVDAEPKKFTCCILLYSVENSK